MELHYQQPNERKTYEIDFTPRLLNGVTVSTATVSGIKLSTDAADNTVLVSTTGTVTTPKVTFTCYNMTDGVRYKITIRATLSQADILEEDVLIQCKAI